MSASDESGSTQTATASRKALTTQIEASGLAPSCDAIEGNAVLAMFPSSTDIDNPIRYVNIAQRRCSAGKPSPGTASPKISVTTSDMLRVHSGVQLQPFGGVACFVNAPAGTHCTGHIRAADSTISGEPERPRMPVLRVQPRGRWMRRIASG